SSRRRHTRSKRDWSSDVCSSDLDLSLAVPAGTVYGFIGPNGSGKTTTLRMIMRILHPEQGVIRVLGETAFGAATDRVGYLPEERSEERRVGKECRARRGLWKSRE